MLLIGLSGRTDALPLLGFVNPFESSQDPAGVMNPHALIASSVGPAGGLERYVLSIGRVTMLLIGLSGRTDALPLLGFVNPFESSQDPAGVMNPHALIASSVGPAGGLERYVLY